MRLRRLSPVFALLALTSVAHAAPAHMTDAAVRAFAARQEAAWNARDLRAFSASFLPDARFIEQARASDNQIVQTGVADLAQAIAQSRRFFANSRFQETATVDHIAIGAEGRQARLSVRQVTRIESPGKPVRTLCAETEQTLVLVDGAIRSRGQTETAMRCP